MIFFPILLMRGELKPTAWGLQHHYRRRREEGLISFGPATILINNSIPRSHGASRGEAEAAPVACGSISAFWRNIRKIGSSLITHWSDTITSATISALSWGGGGLCLFFNILTLLLFLHLSILCLCLISFCAVLSSCTVCWASCGFLKLQAYGGHFPGLKE